MGITEIEEASHVVEGHTDIMLVQLVPRMGGIVCGVGDYAATLAGGLRDRHRMHSRFLAAEVGPGTAGDSILRIERSADALANALRGQNDLLLHYVGYGFEKRGCPLWLMSGLKRWKAENPSSRLTTMFHELSSMGLPWQSSFWVSPVQRWLCREIARLSDAIVTNREAGAGQLLRMAPGRKVIHLPVFSNMGEPQDLPSFDCRIARMVIFGSRRWRVKALTTDVEMIRSACRRWQLEEVIEIGPDDTPAPDLGVPLRKLGTLPAEDVSRWLTGTRFGFLGYPCTLLEKSGIFAAYAAHGVIPLLPGHSEADASFGMVEGEHYLSLANETLSKDALESCSRAVFSWYQNHRSETHVTVFANLLNQQSGR